MGRRKRIALLTAIPEDMHGSAIIEGIRTQCEKYDYDLFIFTPMMHLETAVMKDYVAAEANIYELVNYAEIDGVIIDTVNVVYGLEGKVLERLKERLAEYPDLPVCALEMPIDGFHLIHDENEAILREMCRHMVLKHGKRNISVITGYQGNEIAESRLAIFKDELEKLGVELPDDQVFYGDFWYNSGDMLAKKIASGDVPRPEAILSASDTMALGLISRLIEEGIRVPEDISVISFDGTYESRISEPSLSSFPANDSCSAANAVDYIRSRIEPDAELMPFEHDVSSLLHVGESCGCNPEYRELKNAIDSMLFIKSHNEVSAHVFDEIKIGQLMESYMMEKLTAARTSRACFKEIFDFCYLLNPYLDVCICLSDDWITSETRFEYGYPENMRVRLMHTMEGKRFFWEKEKSYLIKTSDMIPNHYLKMKDAGIYIFTAIHFNGSAMGYNILHRSIHQVCKLTMVYRNWLRYVNNALEMIRDKQMLRKISTCDGLTGCLNRIGMSQETDRMLEEMSAPASALICVVDMDGLKMINDTYGHTEGDLGIYWLARAVQDMAKPGEIVVRAGGDEFYLIGMHEKKIGYSEENVEHRKNEFRKQLRKYSDELNKPYSLRASIGSVIGTVKEKTDIEDLLKKADARMYEEKAEHKKMGRED